MIESGQTVGSIETTVDQKQKFARQSLAYNVRDPMFAKLFPEYVELHKEQQAAKLAACGESTTHQSLEGAPSLTGVHDPNQANLNGLFALGAGVFAILAIAFSMMRFL